jgi:hypothetical protein
MGMPSGAGGGLGAVETAVDESTSSTFITCQPLGPADAAHKYSGAGLEVLMPGLPKCRHMQERVAVVAFEGKKSIALYGVEPLYFTTQLNRSAVPALLSLMGRHSTIPLVIPKSYQSGDGRNTCEQFGVVS